MSAAGLSIERQPLVGRRRCASAVARRSLGPDVATPIIGSRPRWGSETERSSRAPIAKSWPSQWCLEANSLAIQIHGGYGYTRDYDV